MTHYVYRFGGGVSDGGSGDKTLLGGKGANLAEMASIGLPVPPGFTIATTMCTRYYEDGQTFPDSLRDEVATGIAHIEGITAKRFGDEADPLLVSVRSGARVSMPGMMDTVLNLGLNDATVEGLARVSDDPTSPLHILEHAVHPWSAYLILPIFGFANAGVSLAGITPPMLLDPVTLGVALGLFVGKQVGVFGLVVAAVRLGLAQRPAHATWAQVYGVSLLCGVGFTMSLFIGLLAFANAPELEAETKVGVLIGSLACMAAGALVLWLIPVHPSRR